MRRLAARAAAVCVAGVFAVGAAACTNPAPTPTPSGSRAVTPTAGGDTTPTGPATPAPALVVETVFDHTTLDPTRQFERSGALVSKALYQTLTTLEGDNQSKPVPGLAEFTMSPEGNWLTLRIKKGMVFSDGTAITTDDVIFTLNRARGLGGATSALLGNVIAKKVDDRTLTLTSPDSNFALPAVLANPSFGILNSAAVKAQGGTTGPGDGAGPWLATHSAGSGPYVLKDVVAGRSITLSANPYWAGAAPAFPDVLVRNASPAQQRDDIESGAADLVLDLSPEQAGVLETQALAPISVRPMRSSTVAYLALNQSHTVSRWTSNPDFAQAVRLGIDRAVLAQMVPGTEAAPGLVPAGITGSLNRPAPQGSETPSGTPTTSPTGAPTSPSGGSTTPATGTPQPTTSPGGTGATPTTPAPGATSTPPAPGVGRDLAGAKAALARSGYRREPVPLSYASDLPIQGVPSGAIALAVKKQLADVGIVVRLSPVPAARAIAAYRAGRAPFGVWGWTPDYPDPENYLAFAPGGLVGLRVDWPRGVDHELDDLSVAALDSVGEDREAAYTRWQEAMNARSPFVSLLQPSSHHAHGSRVTTLVTSPVWTVDLAAIR